MSFLICDGCANADDDDEEHDCSGDNAVVGGVEMGEPCFCECNREVPVLSVIVIPMEDLHRQWLAQQMLNPN
ncbi:MAG: hypothetical protein PHV43_03095 [Candidatus Colwellbacteria bacterium]|nr:hypothetical protein [Candidatus Colwellbacteria bacterium]